MHNLAAAAAFQAAPLLQEEPQQLKCPRCDSTNTKFCYYNNYNLSQPRHFCRDCRRYWTRGGVLRNIPVGGGTRKSSKRAAASSSSSSPSKRSNTLPSSPTPPAAGAAHTATPPAPSPRIPGGVLSLPDATYLRHPIDSRPSMELHVLGVGGHRSDNMAAPPSGTPVSDAILRLQGDSICRNDGRDWPDLSIFTPGSKSQ